jgi:peptidoglycan/LPS O-acetylase OafA/YrhL
MLFYFVFGIAMWTRSRQASIAVTGLILVSLILMGLVFDLPQPLLYWSNPITLEFIYGMLIATAFRSEIRFTAAVGVLIAALGLTLLILFRPKGLDTPLPMRGFLTGIPAALIVASAALTPIHKINGRGWKFALFWGGASYSLYLMQAFALTIPRHVFGSRFSQLNMMHPYLGLAILILAALVVAALTHLFFEKPVTALLRNRASSIVSLITSLTHGSAPESEPI